MLKYFFATLLLPLSLSSIEYITKEAVYTSELVSNAIIRQEAGFEDDFLLLHCLLKKVNPTTIFEIGTCHGYGTLIMANSCPNSTLVSLELPPNSSPYFIPQQDIGYRCNRPYHQVYGNSLTYDYRLHFPIDAWFIDGAHDYYHVFEETKVAVTSNAKIIIYHDADIKEVFDGIVEGMDTEKYTLYRVTGTRIMFAIDKELNWLQ